MPWLSTVEQIDLMLEYVRKTTPNVTGWWQDTDKLVAYWDMMEWPGYAKAGVGAVPDGDMVAWIGLRSHPTENICVWNLCAFSRPDGRHWIDFKDIGNPWPAAWISYAVARASVPKPAGAVVGDWVACCIPSTMAGRLAKATAVGPKGEVMEVQLVVDGAPVSALQFTPRWFKVNNRDAACAYLWSQQRTEFSHYRNMLGQLALRQRRIDKLAEGKVAKRARKAAKAAPIAQPQLDTIASGQPIRKFTKYAQGLLLQLEHLSETRKAQDPELVALDNKFMALTDKEKYEK